MPDCFNIILLLFNQIQTLLNQFVYGGYHQLSSILQKPLLLCMTLYLVLMGYTISQGWIQCSLKRFIFIAMKFALVYVLATNWDIFSAYVVGLIRDGSFQIAQHLLIAMPGAHQDFSGHDGVQAALQSVLSMVIHSGFSVWRMGSWHNFGPLLNALLIWATGISMVVYVFFQLILSDILLSILFVLSPLFFSFIIFDATRGLFDAWFGYIVTFSLMIMMVSLLLSMVVMLSSWGLEPILHGKISEMYSIAIFVPHLVVSTISIGIIHCVVKMSHTIGSHFSTTRLSRELYEKLF